MKVRFRWWLDELWIRKTNEKIDEKILFWLLYFIKLGFVSVLIAIRLLPHHHIVVGSIANLHPFFQ